MSKTFFGTAILLVVFTQVGFAQQNPSVQIFTNYKLEMMETVLWVLDQGDNRLQYGGKDILLFLDETNPNFFALVYNTLKDHLRDKNTDCYIWTTTITGSPHGNYAKITQIQLR